MPGSIGEERRSKPQDDLMYMESGVINDDGEVRVGRRVESSVHVSAHL